MIEPIQYNYNSGSMTLLAAYPDNMFPMDWLNYEYVDPDGIDILTEVLYDRN